MNRMLKCVPVAGFVWVGFCFVTISSVAALGPKPTPNAPAGVVSTQVSAGSIGGSPPGVPVSPDSVGTQDAGARAIRDTTVDGVEDRLPDAGPPSAPSAPVCPTAGVIGDDVYRDSEENSRTVDPCGNASGGEAGPEAATANAVATIDRMTTTIGYSQTHYTGGALSLFGSADTYYLSDETSWHSGAGTYTPKSSSFDHVEVDGATVRYYLLAPPDGILYKQTDYNSGDHSAQGP